MLRAIWPALFAKVAQQSVGGRRCLSQKEIISKNTRENALVKKMACPCLTSKRRCLHEA
jgi:hypothetical protein